MARPKKADKEEMATVKIENAFWRLLETESYSDITVLRISQEAGTNRNSFYYHYRDIEDLAHKAFMNNAGEDVSKALLSVLMAALQKNTDDNVIDIDPAVLPHSERIMLCARSDSTFLNGMVRDLLQNIWFEYLSIDEALLSKTERLQTTFIFAGLVAVLGSSELRDSPLAMTAMSQTKIGRAVVNTLKSISRAQSIEMKIQHIVHN